MHLFPLATNSNLCARSTSKSNTPPPARPYPRFAKLSRSQLTSVWIRVLNTLKLLLGPFEQRSQFSRVPDVTMTFKLDANLDGTVSPDVSADTPVERVLQVASVERFDVRLVRLREGRRCRGGRRCGGIAQKRCCKHGWRVWVGTRGFGVEEEEEEEERWSNERVESEEMQFPIRCAICTDPIVLAEFLIRVSRAIDRRSPDVGLSILHRLAIQSHFWCPMRPISPTLSMLCPGIKIRPAVVMVMAHEESQTHWKEGRF